MAKDHKVRRISYKAPFSRNYGFHPKLATRSLRRNCGLIMSSLCDAVREQPTRRAPSK